MMTTLLGVFIGSVWEHMPAGRIQAWGAREGFVDKMIFALSPETSARVSLKIVGGQKWNNAHSTSSMGKRLKVCLRN